MKRLKSNKGQVAELVYAPVLGTGAARLKSSSLFLPTKQKKNESRNTIKKGLKNYFIYLS